MKSDEPELFRSACDLEELLNQRRAQLGKDAVYLTRFNRPLAQAIPGIVALRPSPEGDGGCDSGWCAT